METRVLRQKVIPVNGRLGEQTEPQYRADRWQNIFQTDFLPFWFGHYIHTV
jgi:hypothetical protein